MVAPVERHLDASDRSAVCTNTHAHADKSALGHIGYT